MIVTMTSGTYPWLFVTQIFHVGFQPSHGGRAQNFNSTTSRLWFSISRKSPQKKTTPQVLEYRLNCEMYTLYADAVGVLLHINRMFTMGKLKSYLFFHRKFSFFTSSYCLRVGQGMQQAWLYMGYPLFHIQGDQCDLIVTNLGRMTSIDQK